MATVGVKGLNFELGYTLQCSAHIVCHHCYAALLSLAFSGFSSRIGDTLDLKSSECRRPVGFNIVLDEWIVLRECSHHNSSSEANTRIYRIAFESPFLAESKFVTTLIWLNFVLFWSLLCSNCWHNIVVEVCRKQTCCSHVSLVLIMCDELQISVSDSHKRCIYLLLYGLVCTAEFGGIVAGTAVVCIVAAVLIMLLIIRCRSRMIAFLFDHNYETLKFVLRQDCRSRKWTRT